MDLTTLWYQIADMSKSSKTFATVLGYHLTEQQVIIIAGVVVVLLLLEIFRAIAGWIVGGTVKTAVLIQAPPIATTNPAAVDQTKKEPAEEQEKIAKSAEELLTDTSERRRTLHDFVTPDSIHADVLKQTLNNDYPYVTLKPNPTFINTIPSGAFTDVKQVATQGPLPAASGKSELPLLTATKIPEQQTQKDIAPVVIEPPKTAPISTPVSPLPVQETITTPTTPVTPISPVTVQVPVIAEKNTEARPTQLPIIPPVVVPSVPAPLPPIPTPATNSVSTPITPLPIDKTIEVPVGEPVVTAPNYSPTDSLLP
jgi:hypothetical protein